MSILTFDSFTGRYVVAKNTYVNGTITEIIAKFERPYLNKVLGVDLAQILVDDIVVNAPTDPDLLELFEPFSMQDQCTHEIYESLGIVNMLKGFIYYQINSERKEEPSMNGGNVEPDNENSIKTLGDKMFDFYNEAVRTAMAIQYKCMVEREKYPTFRGVKINYASKF